MTQTVIIHSPGNRQDAARIIAAAPLGSMVKVYPPKRTIPQNDRLWAMLSEVSRAKPEGRTHTPEVWKALFMAACGWSVQFEQGLEGGPPFPVGFRSSRLTKEQCGELMDFIAAYCARQGVTLRGEAA